MTNYYTVSELNFQVPAKDTSESLEEIPERLIRGYHIPEKISAKTAIESKGLEKVLLETSEMPRPGQGFLETSEMPRPVQGFRDLLNESEKIVDDDCGYETAKLGLSSYEIKLVNTAQIMKYLETQRDVIQFLDEESVTEEMKLAAVRFDGESIKYIEDPTDEMKLAAVASNGLSIVYIRDSTREMKLIAVRQNGLAILGIFSSLNDNEKSRRMIYPDDFFDFPKYECVTEELVSLAIEALKCDASVIKFIKNPSEEMKLEAVRRDGRTIGLIENPSEEIIKASQVQISFGELNEKLKNEKELEKRLERKMNVEFYKTSLVSLNLEGRVIRFIENPTEEQKLIAVKQNGLSIEFIKEKTQTVRFHAISRNGLAIKFLDNPTLSEQIQAVRQNGLSICFISEPSDEVKLEAVRQNGLAIFEFSNPTNQMKIEAIRQNKSVYEKLV
jgi:hypothetical protein